MQQNETTAERVRKLALAVELDQDELACRILEAQVEARRPKGMTATQALAGQPAELAADVRRAAVAAMRYLEERINAGASVQ